MRSRCIEAVYVELAVYILYIYNLHCIYTSQTRFDLAPAHPWCRLLGDERRSGLCKLAHCDFLPTLPDWGRQLTLKGVLDGGLRVI